MGGPCPFRRVFVCQFGFAGRGAGLRDDLELKVLIFQPAALVNLKRKQSARDEKRLFRRTKASEPGVVSVDAADDKIPGFHFRCSSPYMISRIPAPVSAPAVGRGVCLSGYGGLRDSFSGIKYTTFLRSAKGRICEALSYGSLFLRFPDMFAGERRSSAPADPGINVSIFFLFMMYRRFCYILAQHKELRKKTAAGKR